MIRPRGPKYDTGTITGGREGAVMEASDKRTGIHIRFISDWAAGAQQAQCPYCGARLYTEEQHYDDCTWQAEQAEQERALTPEEISRRHGSGIANAYRPAEDGCDE